MLEEEDIIREVVEEELPHHTLVELFDELTFVEKARKLVRGLSQPHDSGEYKWAKLQMIRLSAPVCAVVVPLICLTLLLLYAGVEQSSSREVQVQIMELERLENLDKEMEMEIEPLKPIEMDFTPDTMVIDSPFPPAPAVEFSPQQAEFDTVAIVKSPVIMKGIFGSRNPGARHVALRVYGGSQQTEGAVLRALRWLKKNQQTDGSWMNHRPAMTGLALLAFLAHGETPASDEFGKTVEKAIRWLVANRDPRGGWPRRYEHAIASYAICEAYALTKIPMLKEVVEKATGIIINGQNPTGGWRYAFNPGDPDDTSCMGWCAQALKAAKMTGVTIPDLDKSMRLAIKGFQKNAHPEGGFGYTDPGKTGLTGVGVLCMQLLGASKYPEARKGLMVLEDATFNWGVDGKFNKNYFWYYITQAKFHTGGQTWNSWNNKFARVLVDRQTIIKDAIMGPRGKLVDIGFWEMGRELSGHTDGPVMNTALCALQLEVYYRYLPTYKPPTDLEEVDFAEDEEDIEIDIEI